MSKDDLYFGRCTDGQMHVVEGESGPPSCGAANVLHLDEGDDDTPVCDACIDIIARFNDIDPDEFRRNIASHMPN
jgi:hypothetical protein